MVVLQFSGGKDSLACLLLLRDRLNDITVVWADSGNAFPETYAQMEKVKAMCPNFVVAKGRQPEVIAEFGYPVDVLPCRNHSQVQHLAQLERPKLQCFLDCCTRSFFFALDEATKALGATVIIRGQKLSDEHKSPVRSGDVIDGITYFFPIEDWTDEQVMELVKNSDLLPEHYEDANTSLDCMNCTAYLEDNQWKLPYLRKHHPETAVEVTNRLKLIRQEVMRDMRHVESLLENNNDKL